MINLPGKPASIEVCLNAVMPAVPYCLDLIGAAYIETNPQFVQAFRPKSDVSAIYAVIAEERSDEAIHSRHDRLDCFASLAMTA